MTKEQVIAMAREAGFEFQENIGITGRRLVTTLGSQPIEKIEALITLVRNAALEEAAKKCKSMDCRGYGHDCSAAIRNLKEPTT